MNKNIPKFYYIAMLAVFYGGYHRSVAAKTLPVVASLAVDTVKSVTLYAKIPVSSPLFVVQSQIDALNRQDLKASMDAMHPSSPAFQTTKDFGKMIFENYQLRFKLQSTAIESITADTAKVRFTQTTKKITGPEFRNNRVDGVHILKKYKGKWKIYDTKTIKIEYLDN